MLGVGVGEGMMHCTHSSTYSLETTVHFLVLKGRGPSLIRHPLHQV